jgi:hypothetical protein
VRCSAFSIPSLNFPGFRSIPVLLLVMAACSCSRADVTNAKSSSCSLNDSEVTGLSGDAGTQINAISNYSKTIYRMFRGERFEQLDCLADSANLHKELFSGGFWKIHTIHAVLEKPPLHATEEDWITHIELLEKWVAARPRSITARVALADAYVTYGEDARGHGYANTVSESGWRLLAERTAKAKQILEQASTLPTKDPEWYMVMQEITLEQGADREAMQTVFEQAVKSEPTYYYYYRGYVISILPQWGGEEGEVAAFLKKAADGLGGDAGDIVYFRVAATLVCGCQTDHGLNLSWPRIVNGFEATEKQYGPSPENWNLLAHIAPAFGDGVVADKMFARIGDQWSEEIWTDFTTFESSRKWAKEAAPIGAKRQLAEESVKLNLNTAEGKQYNAIFAGQIHAWMQPCLEGLTDTDLRTFELLIQVGKAGTIDEINGVGDSPIMPCLGQKIRGFRSSRQSVFPPPPRPDYWVRFDLAPEDAPLAVLK